VPYAGFHAGASTTLLGGAGGTPPRGGAPPSHDDGDAWGYAPAAVLLPYAGSLPVALPPAPRCAIDSAAQASASAHAHAHASASSAAFPAPHPLSPVNILKSAGFRARKAAATEAVAAKPTAPRVLFADRVDALAAAADAALHGRGAAAHALPLGTLSTDMEF
jgi:hypothetical protein